MTEQLFRREALEHQRSRLEGELVVIQPLSHHALAALVTGLVVLTALYLGWGTYSRKQTVRGYLLPEAGVVKVFAPQGSILVQRYVEEGDTVQRGDVLFTLSSGRVNATGERIDSQLLAALDRQRQLLEGGLRRVQEQTSLSRTRLEARQRQLAEEVERLASLTEVRREQAALSEEATLAVEDMAKEAPGIISRDERRRRRARYLEESQRLEESELSLSVKRAELENVALELRALPIERAAGQATLQQQLSELEGQRVSQGSDQAFAVLAPTSGRVTALQAREGQLVALPTPLCAIVPEGDLQAEVYVPTRAAGWVDPGQQVRLMYDAFPHEHYGVHHATVLSVAEAILDPREIDSPVPLQEPVYAARLRLSSEYLEAFGKSHALQAGMLLTGHVILEERSLWRWLMRPLYALAEG